MVGATSKASDQPAHTRSLIRAFAYRLNILWTSFGVSKLNMRLQRLVWVYTCQYATLLEITFRGSNQLSKTMPTLTLYLLVSVLALSMINFANSFDPDHAQQNVGPDLDPKCLTHWWCFGKGKTQIKIGISNSDEISCPAVVTFLYESPISYISHFNRFDLPPCPGAIGSKVRESSKPR